MQRRTEGYYGRGGTTQANFTTLEGSRLHRWKAYDISHLDSQTGPSSRLEFQIFCRRRARQAQNCIALGAVTLSVEAFTDGVAASGSLLELQIKRGLRLN